MNTLSKFQGKGGGKLSAGTVQDTEDETKPLLSATKQKQFLGAWRNYRSGAAAENNGDDSEKGKKESGTEHKEGVCMVLWLLNTYICPLHRVLKIQNG
jgi:hypothetical protein